MAACKRFSRSGAHSIASILIRSAIRPLFLARIGSLYLIEKNSHSVDSYLPLETGECKVQGLKNLYGMVYFTQDIVGM